ncbi:hypothetical protein FF1_038739 [Malus domestica]
MTQLTSLGITNVKASDEMDLCDSLQTLELLQHLFLMASDEEEFLRVNALRSPPADLQMVNLEKEPLWFGSLHNLTCMQLNWSRLEEDVLPHIQASPNLERLGLINAYVLDIDDCMELKTLPQGIEFLANVERLNLESIPMQLIESVKGGMDHPKAQHIPEINLDYGWYHESFSGIHSRRRNKLQKHLS